MEQNRNQYPQQPGGEQNFQISGQYSEDAQGSYQGNQSQQPSNRNYVNNMDSVFSGQEYVYSKSDNFAAKVGSQGPQYQAPAHHQQQVFGQRQQPAAAPYQNSMAGIFGGVDDNISNNNRQVASNFSQPNNLSHVFGGVDDRQQINNRQPVTNLNQPNTLAGIFGTDDETNISRQQPVMYNHSSNIAGIFGGGEVIQNNGRQSPRIVNSSNNMSSVFGGVEENQNRSRQGPSNSNSSSNMAGIFGNSGGNNQDSNNRQQYVNRNNVNGMDGVFNRQQYDDSKNDNFARIGDHGDQYQFATQQQVAAGTQQPSAAVSHGGLSNIF